MLNNNKLIKFKSKKIKQKSFWFKRKKPLRSLKPVRLISIRQYHWKPDKRKERKLDKDNISTRNLEKDKDIDIERNETKVEIDREIKKEKKIKKENNISYSKESKIERSELSQNNNKKYLIKDVIFFVLTIIANYCIFVLYFDNLLYWFLSYVVYMLIIKIFSLDRFRIANTILVIILFLYIIVIMYKWYNYLNI